MILSDIGLCVGNCFEAINEYLSVPMLILVFVAGIVMTWAFDFVQVRYFVESWRYIFKPDPAAPDDASKNISALQAFLGALSTSMGNGSLAGMGVAIF
jgi:Na+/alanine symporter